MTRRHRTAGFTLMELAVVLAIVALLLGGMLMPLAAQIDLRNRQDTEKALVIIQEALMGFALINGRLPCPAKPTLVSATGGTCPAGGAATVAGCEATRGAGATLACDGSSDETPVSGVLPWATLGLAEIDAWGNRYTYSVAPLYARGIDAARTDFGGSDCPLNPADHHTYNAALADGPRQSAFAICTPGTIAVLAAAGGTTLASRIPAVVVSHGKNGGGAYTPQGNRIALPANGGDEDENADDDATFVSNNASDDLVVWIPRNLLVGRMLAAGKLP